MAKRIRLSALSGTLLTDISDSDSSFESEALEDLRIPTIEAPYVLPIMWLSEDPAVHPEIMWITAHTAGEPTADVWRGQETGSGNEWGNGPARAHTAGDTWIHGPTPMDFVPDYTSGSSSNPDSVIDLAPWTYITMDDDIVNINPAPGITTVTLLLIQPDAGPTGEWASNTGINIFWVDGTPPVLSAVNEQFDVIRLTSLVPNGLFWIGEVLIQGQTI